MRTGEIDQFSINAFFAANEVTLNFNENVFAAERIDKQLRVVSRILGSARLQRAGFGILPKRTFGESRSTRQVESKKSSRMQNAFASTLQACAPLSGCLALISSEAGVFR